ncbi:unnamed protein product [Dibothriocephalus latus]|uniref:Uncharacterized protein n=1 Tax=Dibothriocephalus latus TaxID=60516 RepID=A0A3P6SD96_DIBLA|nr:unnamed protein product [Dibothriocephalus latus]
MPTSCILNSSCFPLLPVGSLPSTSVKSPITPEGVITSTLAQGKPLISGAAREDPNSPTGDSTNQSTNRSAAQQVRRQLSMVDLDKPKGPDALTSAASSRFTSTTEKPSLGACHHVGCCHYRQQRGTGRTNERTNDYHSSMTPEKLKTPVQNSRH